jgi:pimeloyl-ACP methyl ester carboxylesterase
VRVQLPGGTAPIYVEEAGTGPALLCLHTAGADSRQYHGLLGHPELRARWRIVAFDLPQHGRSGRAEAMLEGAWRLDTDHYVAIIRSVVSRLGLVRPVVLGCSMGGQICLELAYRHPDEFAAVIACEAAALVPGRKVTWAKHPRVNQALFVPEWIDGLMGPGTVSARRAAVRHAYAQGAYGVFHGDIEFYSGDWDARDRLSQIDTTRCPVHMLTGEYDYSCTPAMSRETAEIIRGATFQELPGLGHFPMAEDPTAFLDYLAPILERVRS